MNKRDAILLLGPTGSGKTPLGDLIAARGLFGRRCVHLDFGAQLRRIAAHGSERLGPEVVTFVQGVLHDGLLLENDTFHIARAILESFMDEHDVATDDLVVLNGLPRHAGQARDLSALLKVILVVALDCTAATVHARIATDVGGDRAGRTDDSLTEIARKLEIYTSRTRPLLQHYDSARVPCRRIAVGSATSAQDLCDALHT